MHNQLNKRVLFISYDGMTDPLGQSQVIPYLQGLSKQGHAITILSFEKPGRFEKGKSHIESLLQPYGIEWQPVSYTKSPPVLSTIWDVYRMRTRAFALHAKNNFSLVHCRSYIAALVGLAFKRKKGIPFIFDMRGFYADERVDGGLWELSSPLYKRVYDFFKKKEREFLTEADYTISLTAAAKNIIHGWNYIPNQPIPIEVIPCCADLDKFSPANVDRLKKAELQNKLGIKEGQFVLSYLGSVGTWYMLDEMLDFFSVLLEHKPEAKFLFITNEPKELILNKAVLKNIATDRFIISAVAHAEVPTWLSLSDYSIFFIKPVFSKQASSPVKQGELMGMGIPHICNTGVGDVDDILANSSAGIVVYGFNIGEYNKAVSRIINSPRPTPETVIGLANKVYSLKSGVEKYISVYRKLLE
jgi:glycosyltransferase involved in cell wall biosynthesis